MIIHLKLLSSFAKMQKRGNLSLRLTRGLTFAHWVHLSLHLCMNRGKMNSE